MKLGKQLIWIAPLVVILVGGTVALVSHQNNTKTSEAVNVSGTANHTKPVTNGSGTQAKNTPAPAPTQVMSSNPDAKKVDLSAYNAKETQLTDEAVKIYQQINDKYNQVQKGTLSPADFKKQMVPLRDQMKVNFDEYKAFTEQNGVSYADHDSQAFKQGVALASGIRLDEYTFLINVTTFNMSKEKIAAKYKETLSTFESRLQQYHGLTKNL
ncbi:MAG: hypothetical protein ACXVP5_07825 [Tumebacillaceae bacterium]